MKTYRLGTMTEDELDELKKTIADEMYELDREIDYHAACMDDLRNKVEFFEITLDEIDEELNERL